jgi:putative transposase
MNSGLFRNKYKIASARAPWWDYRNSAPYFVTGCTRNQRHFFGFIENGEMHLNDLGKYAWECWFEIPDRFPFVELINFVVMPNHNHGLMYLHNESLRNNDSNDVETLHATSLPPQPPQPQQKNEQMANISPKQGSLSTVIRSYKSAVTKFANHNNMPAGWQARFHDHIVRNAEEYQRIFDYITNNPKNWKSDKFYGM